LLEASNLLVLKKSYLPLASLGYVAKDENAITSRRDFQKAGAQRSHYLDVFKKLALQLFVI
tara:strand:- start:133 stop:315 length:183 start_codon:yes stop_codon:yes gene_type:complete